MGKTIGKSVQSQMLLLQFYVDLFEEEGVLPLFLKETVDCHSNVRDITYVDDWAVKQILSLSCAIYQDAPKRCVDDAFDMCSNYCNAPLTWILTAKNVPELIDRIKRFDTSGMIRIVPSEQDTLKIELGKGYEVEAHRHMFCISIMLGVLKICVPSIDIDVHYSSNLPELDSHIRDRGKCYIKPGFSTPILVLHAPNLLEIPLETSNEVLSAILEPNTDFAYIELCKLDLVSEAQFLIKTSLHKQDFSLNDLVADMGISRRSLQRRLKENQLTFNKLLRNERRKKAIQLIDEGQHDRSRIVEMVGYSELSSLYRLVRDN